MKNSILKRRIARSAVPVCAAFLLGGAMSSCEDDLLTGQPSWLGESIYEELESRGNFTETLKLINAQDEDYATLLRRTGSKTMFVADDEAWARFYKNNPWGVTSIDEMTPAQKKLLFKGNILTSAYLLELLGNLPGTTPTEGALMRRRTELSGMDTVMYLPRTKFPGINEVRRDLSTSEQIDYWSDLRGKEGVYIVPMRDYTGETSGFEAPTMIHFMPRFMQNNNITGEDVEFLTNGEIKTNIGAFVNGKVVRENEGSEPHQIMQDITCQNGYIHVLQDVAVPLDNMANVISANPQFSIYNRLLDRFSVPKYSYEATLSYHGLYGGDPNDSVYVRRYFNKWDTANEANPINVTSTDKGATVTSLLPYDPSWYLYRLNPSEEGSAYRNDAAVMLVPSDEAMMRYLETDGADLNERYGKAGTGATAWDNAPDAVVLPLLQNTMLTSLKAAVPSQFANINNSAGERMGVEKKDVDSVIWASNGVIYQTNKVYVAPEYVSVYYPCIIRDDEDMHSLHTVIEEDNNTQGGEGFRAYLTNMGSKYSFFIPTDKAMHNYFDPVSYKRTDTRGDNTAVLYSFYVNDAGTLAANPYLVDWNTLDGKGWGYVSESVARNITLATGKSGEVFNRFKDIFNSSLCTSLIQWPMGESTPQRFFQTKGGGPVVVEWDETTHKVKGVAGSFQYERGYYIPVVEEYDKSQEGNGVSFVVDDEPLMSTFMSPDSALHDPGRADQFGSFAQFVGGGLTTRAEGTYSSHATMDYALTNLDNYHYTIYVPTNASIDALVAEHKLLTWEEVEEVEACAEVIAQKLDDLENEGASAAEIEAVQEEADFINAQVTRLTNLINNFVNYHIQDNAVYIDGEDHSGDVYETACLDTLTSRFVKVSVSYNRGGDLYVTDNCGNRRTVSKDGYNNVLTRQYYFDKSSIRQSTMIFSSSYAVLHQIDAPLVPSQNFYYDEDSYNRVQDLIAKYPAEDDTPTPNPAKRKRR